MDAPATLGRGDTLDTVTPGLLEEIGIVLRGDRRCTVAEYGSVQSALCVEEPPVGVRQITNKQLGIVTAFSGAQFDTHRWSPIEKHENKGIQEQGMAVTRQPKGIRRSKTVEDVSKTDTVVAHYLYLAVPAPQGNIL